jgi:ribosomal protein S18 acetylase RimI-like enzyme
MMVSMTANIRPYREGDHDEVIALWKACFDYPSPHNDPEQAIRRKTSLNDNLFFVAESGEKILGTVMAGWDGHRGWIYSLAVENSRRREGIGRDLVTHAVKRLTERDCPKVNLQVMPGNESVVGFYRKLGFEKENRISMGLKLY